ncbi:MAG: hypothetical protein ACM30E_13440 [Nitrososphaerales archaeon]
MPHTLSRTSRRLLVAIRAAAVVMILLDFAALLLPEQVAWGLWPIRYVPLGVTCVLAAGALVLATAGEWLWERATALRELLARIRFGSPGVRALLAIVAGVLFSVFRIQNLRWGDAALLIKALADPYRLTYVWQAPLDVYLHEKAWQLGNSLFGWPSPLPVYRIFSTLAGMIFVWVLLGLAELLGRNRTERALFAGLVLTLGTMQLFFGYVENYPIMTLGVLIYTYLAMLCLRRKAALVWPAIALAITNAFHPSTIILTPSIIYLVFVTSEMSERNVQGSHGVFKEQGPRLSARSVLSVAVPYGIVLGGVIALMTAGEHGLDALMGVDFPGGGDRSWFVPLFKITTEWQHYTMFSLGHLIDVVNQQLLVARMVWLTIVLVLVLARHRVRDLGREGVFLAVMAGFYLLLTLVWNADYGGQKDWDLFSPAAIPAALLLGWLLVRALPERRALRAAGWAIVSAQGFHLIAWIWQNTRPQ